MYCKYCGADNPDGAKFCGCCGHSFAESELFIPEAQGNAAVLRAGKVKPEDGWFFKGVGFFKKLMIYAIGVLLTFFTAMLVFAYTSPEYFGDMISYISRFFY